MGIRVTSLGLGSGGSISPGPLQSDGVLFATGAATFSSDSTNFSWDQTGFRLTTTNGFRFGDGSAATPALAFTSQTGFGWYRSAAGEMALSNGAGARAAYLTSGGDFFLESNTGTVRFGATADVFIARGSAGQFRIFTGSTLAIEISSSQLFRFLGATAAFPALRRSGTTLQVRLADDSAYGGFDAGSYAVGGAAGFSGTVAPPLTITVVNGIVTNVA